MLTVESQIREVALRNGSKTAVVNGKRSCSYAELWQRIANVRSYLLSRADYKEGGCIVMAASKQLEFIYAYFAAHLAHLVVVPIDEATNPTRLSHIVQATKPIMFVGLECGNTDAASLSYSLLDEVSLHGTTYSENTGIDLPLDEVADILFTTGTTGEPKGVPLTNKNLAAAASHINNYIGNTPEDNELLALPVSHSFGLGRLRCCLVNGQTIVLMGNLVNVGRLFRTIEQKDITGFSMVPAGWKFLLKTSGTRLADYAQQLRYIEMGSAYLSIEDKRELAELFPDTRMVMHYGLTEASRSAFLEFHSDSRHLDTVGRAAPNTDIRVFDEYGHCLPAGSTGELCVKGDHVTHGYLNHSNTDTFFAGGYFRTGDCGSIDEDGYITLQSRIKELINVGGKKVAPAEVDEQIMRVEGIVDCACTAAPDPDGILGEVVKAYVVRDPAVPITFDSIRKLLASRLETYKQPVIYTWVNSIPRTPNGKIQRNLLANQKA